MSEFLHDRDQALPVGLVYASDPEDAGFDSQKLRRAAGVVESALHACGGPIRSASLSVVRAGRVVLTRTWEEPANRPYLVASLTKPVTALGALLLLQEGQLYLDAKVSDILPEFGRRGKEAIRLRHLLTHTSGLPDMLPQNLELRAAHAPLGEYYARLQEIEPLFQPGSHVCYQSMGFLVLARLIEALSGQTLPSFLSGRVFLPLGLTATSLGVKGTDLGVEVQLPDDQVGKDWNWNSPYWRALGAPWGGLLATSLDLAALIYAVGSASFKIGGGSYRVGSARGANRLLAPQIQAAMRLNQTEGLSYFDGTPTYGATDSTTSNLSGTAPAWGLGWRLNVESRRSSTLFGDLASPQACGHTGATGTAFWYDPDCDVAFCLLTTWPAANREKVAARVSNAVLSAIADGEIGEAPGA